MPKSRLIKWRGVTLAAVGIIAIFALAVSGDLDLYIHPRYFEFTVIMAVIGAVAVVAALVVGARGDAHDHDEPGGPMRVVVSATVIVASAVALLAVPPQSLSTSGVTAGDVLASTPGGSEPAPIGADSASFTVKDWAGLLRQGADESFLEGRTADVIGFVTPDDEGGDTFYLVRFAVTCCAVDAQPVGIPVLLPDWNDQYPPETWLRMSGGFVRNPAPSVAAPVVLDPESVEIVEEPDQPYVY